MAVVAWFEVASLRHMSICTRIVVAVTFEQVNEAPHAETGAEGDHEGLKDLNCGSEKCHK